MPTNNTMKNKMRRMMKRKKEMGRKNNRVQRSFTKERTKGRDWTRRNYKSKASMKRSRRLNDVYLIPYSKCSNRAYKRI